MTAEEQIINRICELQPEYHKSEAMEFLTKPGDEGDILRYFMQAAKDYASQQRTDGIREGFSAAREVMSGYDKDHNGTNFHQDEIDERLEAFQMVSKYPSINHYLNRKQ